MGARTLPLKHNIMLESNPQKSRISVWRLGVAKGTPTIPLTAQTKLENRHSWSSNAAQTRLRLENTARNSAGLTSHPAKGRTLIQQYVVDNCQWCRYMNVIRHRHYCFFVVWHNTAISVIRFSNDQ